MKTPGGLLLALLVCIGCGLATSDEDAQVAQGASRLSFEPGHSGGGGEPGVDAGAIDGGCVEQTERKEIDGRKCDCTTRICQSQRQETRGNCTETQTSTTTTYVCVDVETGATTVSASSTTHLVHCSSGCTHPYRDSRLPKGANATMDSSATTTVSVNGGPPVTTTGVTFSWRGANGGWNGGSATPPAPGNDISTCF